MSSSREESPTKRQMADDETPRPRRKRIQYPRSDSSYSLASRSQASEHSGLAGRLSPQKHLNALELGNEGIVVRELASLRDPPTSLTELLKTMRQISRGRHILDSVSRIELGKHTHPAIVEIAEDDACFSPSRGDLGHVPDSTSILNVLDAAIECQENFHAESSWNMLVHSQLLQLALHQPGAPSFSHFVNYMPCSTASILPNYLPPYSPSKKVDFCIYLEPAREPTSDTSQLAATQSLIQTARVHLTGNVINHTDYYPLRQRPMALGIETKKTGEGWDSAALQIGVWHVAHWDLLTELSRTDTQDETVSDARPQKARLPEFLPGLIIQGHDWYLVVTTREASQTILWTKLTIGTTSNVMGIYQIILGLQVLRRWAQYNYWPLFRQLIMPK
ncbi:hypothetical protein BGZ61DRAFT_371520 [Ilyonectria robusta]|uniref:uncharacterized protein n=1 Tax=Ilyonectria robusta TaxID=1079257 RepID=UPI001E8CC1D0|nr:uncharacterized protein BGZ61DRAFT_371520 [Ilyonectria robusta]KAH8657295.1 hypothetical protein BGZ61DRAFT_371520 [Ilyonectria robusta]